MQLFEKLKRGLKATAVAALTACMALGPATSAYAASASSDEVVGNLCIAALYADGSSITDGHSFVIFTSYKDGLELNFKDLWGYYEMTDEFKASVESDMTQLSWRAQFEEVSKQIGSDVSFEEYYEGCYEDERAQKYPELYKAIYNYGNSCYKYTEGAKGSDDRYRTTSYDCTVNAGEYITLGDYTFTSHEDMAKDAVLDSSLRTKLAEIMGKNFSEEAQEKVLATLQGYVLQYQNGEIDANELVNQVESYMKSVLVSGYQDFANLVDGDYRNLLRMLDGDSKGGVFVNRELWRQKVYQTLHPNEVYSIDITQSQLDRMMTLLNSGSENHYAVLAHNCSTFAANVWNAAVGTDASGNKTALYMDATDDTYPALSGVFATPRKISSVVDSWGNLNLGGTEYNNLFPIRGVDLPSGDKTSGTDASDTKKDDEQKPSEEQKPADNTKGDPTTANDKKTDEQPVEDDKKSDEQQTTEDEKKSDEQKPAEEKQPEVKTETKVEVKTETKTASDTTAKSESKAKAKTAVPQTGDSNAMMVVAPLAVLGGAALLVARRRMN